MTETLQFRSGALSHRKPTRFRMVPDEKALAKMAEELGLQKIKFLSFEGEIAPSGRSDFLLTAQLKADVLQSCVVSLAPVFAGIDETVSRRYSTDPVMPDSDDYEIPQDDGPEPLPDILDMAEVLQEALALALPLYPRAPGAALGEAIFAAPGTTPIKDDDLKPFAALAGLVRKDTDSKE